jgi:hypothetical protein
MTEDKILPGAKLFEFLAFACTDEKASYVGISPDGNNIIFNCSSDELPCTVPRYQLTWGAAASMSMRSKFNPLEQRPFGLGSLF